MSHDLTTIKDIESALSMLKPEDIATLMGKLTIHKKQRFHQIDYSFRERRNNITSLYFSCEPAIYKFPDFKEYNGHADSIREQVISGVDI